MPKEEDALRESGSASPNKIGGQAKPCILNIVRKGRLPKIKKV